MDEERYLEFKRLHPPIIMKLPTQPPPEEEKEEEEDDQELNERFNALLHRNDHLKHLKELDNGKKADKEIPKRKKKITQNLPYLHSRIPIRVEG